MIIHMFIMRLNIIASVQKFKKNPVFVVKKFVKKIHNRDKKINTTNI